jgi:tryptophan 2,3-dioxygenase
VPEPLFARDPVLATEPNEALQEELLRAYHAQPELVILFELMTDFDEGFQEWRYRHIKLVERTIGAKRGTGGSPGVEFLKQSLWKPLFPDLWAIRHRM